MKANAPEKLYFGWSDKGILDIYSNRESNDDIEYSRTDAFIEKAEKYLKSQFIKDTSVLTGGAVHINFSTAIKNFVNYMKGE